MNYTSLLVLTLIISIAHPVHGAPGYKLSQKIDGSSLSIALEHTDNCSADDYLASPTMAMNKLDELHGRTLQKVTHVSAELRNFQWDMQPPAKRKLVQQEGESDKAWQERRLNYFEERTRLIENNFSFLDHSLFSWITSLNLTGLTLSHHVNLILSARLNARLLELSHLRLIIGTVEGLEGLDLPKGLTSLTVGCRTFSILNLPASDVRAMLARVTKLQTLSSNAATLPTLIKYLPNLDRLTTVNIFVLARNQQYPNLEEQLLRCHNLRTISIGNDDEVFKRLDDEPLDSWVHGILHQRPLPLSYPTFAHKQASDADDHIKDVCHDMRAIVLTSARQEAIADRLKQLTMNWPTEAFTSCSEKNRQKLIQTLFAKLGEIISYRRLSSEFDGLIITVFQPLITYIAEHPNDTTTCADTYKQLGKLITHVPLVSANYGVSCVVAQLLKHALHLGSTRTSPDDRYCEVIPLLSAIIQASPEVIAEPSLAYQTAIQEFIEISFFAGNYNGREISSLCESLYATELRQYIVETFMRKIALIRENLSRFSVRIAREALIVLSRHVTWDYDSTQFTQNLSYFLTTLMLIKEQIKDQQHFQSILNSTVYPENSSIKTMLGKNIFIAPQNALAENVDIILAIREQLSSFGDFDQIVLPQCTQLYRTAFVAGGNDEARCYVWLDRAIRGLAQTLSHLPANKHTKALQFFFPEEEDPADGETGENELTTAMAMLSLDAGTLSPRSRSAQATNLQQRLKTEGREFLLRSIAEASNGLPSRAAAATLADEAKDSLVETFSSLLDATKCRFDDSEVFSAAFRYILNIIRIGGKQSPVGLKILHTTKGLRELNRFIKAVIKKWRNCRDNGFLAAAVWILDALVTADQEGNLLRHSVYFPDEDSPYKKLLLKVLEAAHTIEDTTITQLGETLAEKIIERYGPPVAL